MNPIRRLSLPLDIELRLDINYTYYEGYPANETDPPEEASVEIHQILWDGLDITAIVSEEKYQQLETLLLEYEDNHEDL